MKPHSIHANRGFSLLEALIVVSMTMVIAGTSIPKMMNVLASMEIRSATRSAAGVMQSVRMMAVKVDQYRTVRYYNAASGAIVYGDVDNNNQPGPLETQAFLGTTVLAYSAPAGIDELDATQLSFTPSTSTSITFSPTGMPCADASTCGTGVVMYFTNSRTNRTPAWGAISISPGGRVSTWLWNGSAWAQ